MDHVIATIEILSEHTGEEIASTFYEMKNALLKTDDYLREISDLQRRPTNFSQNEWNNLKRLAENLVPLSREDFVIIGELCKVLKVFHVETCRKKTVPVQQQSPDQVLQNLMIWSLLSLNSIFSGMELFDLKKTMLAPSVEPDDDELDDKEEIEENVFVQQQID
uniref:Uncharacterized protein n=1 Tax=Globodera rostochiensis TaxID=31243 RepID=A0A914HIQ8_GLORO